MLWLAAILSFFTTTLLLPVVIRFFITINLVDTPEKRKVHSHSIPSMAGVAIFLSLVVVMLFFVPLSTLSEKKFFLVGILLSFILGFRDDISPLQARHKITIQTFAAFLVSFFAGVRLDSLHGVFGIYEIPMWLGVALTIFLIMALSNAFNLIDGVDGLAGITALSIFLGLGAWFIYSGNEFYSLVSLTLASALIGFLIFNWHPARIFMGDTGSMFIGFILSIMSLLFINENSALLGSSKFHFTSYVSMAVAALIIPIYDTFRVMIIRVSAGGSPFFPDKKHIHHILLKQGFNHSKTTLILFAFNLFCVLLAFTMQGLNDTVIILTLGFVSFSFGFLFDFRLKKYLSTHRKNARKEREMFISRSA